MNQFDVHRTTGRTRLAAPYVVIVQSERLARLPTRVVIPLTSLRGDDFAADVAPVSQIEGKQVRLIPWQIFTISVTALGPLVASLANDRDCAPIIRAIDALISQTWH